MPNKTIWFVLLTAVLGLAAVAFDRSLQIGFVDDYVTKISVEKCDIGKLGPDAEVEFSIKLVNRSDKRIRLVGSEMCCSASLSSLPDNIEPTSTLTIAGTAFSPTDFGPVVWEGKIFIDTSSLEVVPFTVSASVTDLLEHSDSEDASLESGVQ